MNKTIDSDYNKRRCEELRKIRIDVAKEFGLDGLIRKEPCDFNGECSGTCLVCMMEEKILLEEIYKRKKEENFKKNKSDYVSPFNNNSFTGEVNNEFLNPKFPARPPIIDGLMVPMIPNVIIEPEPDITKISDEQNHDKMGLLTSPPKDKTSSKQKKKFKLWKKRK